MRRALASLLLTVSLVFATISWSGFILTRTVFDPGRSERLAEELLDNEEVRGVIIGRLAETIDESVPAEIEISDAQLNRAAGRVLDDPRVNELIKDQLVVAHQNALNGVDDPVTVDATVIGQATRDAAIAEQPLLDLVLPAASPYEVTLPTTGFAWLGTVNNLVHRVTLTAGLIALAGIAISLLITSKRSKVLRRVAYWALGAAAFWIVAAFVAPWIINYFFPASMVLVSAAINVFFGAMIPPAIALSLVGLFLYGLSAFLPRFGKQKTAQQLQPARQSRQAAGQFDNRQLQRQQSQQQLQGQQLQGQQRQGQPVQQQPFQQQPTGGRPQNPGYQNQSYSDLQGFEPRPPKGPWQDAPTTRQPPPVGDVNAPPSRRQDPPF